MKITYTPNPLTTIIELDEHEKKELWYKIKIEELRDALYSAHFYLDKDLQRVKDETDPDYYYSTKIGEKSKLDERVDMLLAYFLEDLKSSHAGDCTCIPASCGKCHAEDMLGIHTIKGLEKHSATKIQSAFKSTGSINEVLKSLKNYKPIRSDVWTNWPQEDFDQHVPRWTEEAKHAYEWLLKYRDEHFPV